MVGAETIDSGRECQKRIAAGWKEFWYADVRQEEKREREYSDSILWKLYDIELGGGGGFKLASTSFRIYLGTFGWYYINGLFTGSSDTQPLTSYPNLPLQS